MQMENEALHEACLTLAKKLLWQRAPIDVTEIEALTADLYRVSVEQHELVEGIDFSGLKNVGEPIDVLIRAVHYINEVHAMPPIRANIPWFDATLRTLMELALPNSVPDEHGNNFLRDVRNGIDALLRT